MCNYCDVTKNRFERMIELKSKLKQSPDFTELSIETLNGKAYLTELVGEDDLDISNIYAAEISYCPICGRKLVE